MRIKTEINKTIPASGIWPVNFINDLNNVREIMSNHGFVGTPITMVLHDKVNRLFYDKIEGTDRSWGEYVFSNKLVDELVVLRFNEIDLKKDSVLFITHEISTRDYPCLELGVYGVEMTDLYGRSL